MKIVGIIQWQALRFNQFWLVKQRRQKLLSTSNIKD